VDLNAAWRSAFQSWPAHLPKAGIIVIAQESIPFIDFLIADSFVIVERDRPDSQGGRKLIIALSAIVAVKLLTPDQLSTLTAFTESAAPAVDDGFGAPTGLASRAAAAARKTVDLGRRGF
jgi:hypothetical protein